MATDGNLRRLFRENLRDFDWLAVETGLTTRGVPDANYCCDGAEGWIEAKTTIGWRVAVRPAQVGWAERRLRCGGRVFVAVRRKRAELWLFSGWALRPLTSRRLDTVAPLGCWRGGPSRWDWEEVRQLLTVPAQKG